MSSRWPVWLRRYLVVMASALCTAVLLLRRRRQIGLRFLWPGARPVGLVR
jgi:hypothetical protein